MTIQRDFVGYGRNPPKVEWPGGARLALNIAVHYEEGGEFCKTFGDPFCENWGLDGVGIGKPRPSDSREERELTVEPLFDYGGVFGVWRLLDILDEWEVKATFFCVGRALEANPKVAQAIPRRGHEVASGGYRWMPHRDLPRDEEHRQLHLNVATLKRLTGVRPVGQRTFAPSVNTRELLVEEGGFAYDSDFLADDLPWFTTVNGKKWLLVPHTVSCDDLRYARLSPLVEPEDLFIYLQENFDRLYEEGARIPKMMTVALRPRISGLASRATAVERFIQHARSHTGVWFARRNEIAQVWWEQFGGR